MPRNTRLSIRTQEDFAFPQAICSYGYFLLEPNRWSPEEQALYRIFDAAEWGLDAEPFATVIDQPEGRGSGIRVRCDRPISVLAAKGLRAAVLRMTHAQEDTGVWRKAHPRAARRGFGRLFRSPTLFEDMVKTITNCNVGWQSTIRMNRLMVEHIGAGAFPAPEQLARWTPSRFQKRCGVGYRAKRIVGLARRFERGEIDPLWFESEEVTDEELREALLAIDGFGPYATANVMQLLGRYGHLPIDTESYRLYCKVTKTPRPKDAKRLDARIESRYRRYGKQRFLAYWFELWRDYESRRGDAWTWDPNVTGSSFTASQLGEE